MKKSYIFIALAMVAALTTVSCKCSSKKSQEPTAEEVQEMKQALADSVLAEIDLLAEQLVNASSNSFQIKDLELTDAEKLAKPDYLLDPSVADTLITKKQKINALGIYLVDYGIRKIYDMPQDEAIATIAKLASELNHPRTIDEIKENTQISKKIRNLYSRCRERGDIAYFWQLEEAIGTEISYLLVQAPDLFFDRITEEQWQGYYKRRCFCCKSISELAQYDEEMASLIKFINQDWTITDHDKSNRLNSTIASAKEYRVAQKDLFIAKRNALLQ